MPAADRDVITRAMGVTPVRLRACDVSPCRRDRYFWTNLPARTKRCVGGAPAPPRPSVSDGMHRSNHQDITH
jgi:hypothetical protein